MNNSELKQGIQVALGLLESANKMATSIFMLSKMLNHRKELEDSEIEGLAHTLKCIEFDYLDESCGQHKHIEALKDYVKE